MQRVELRWGRCNGDTEERDDRSVSVGVINATVRARVIWMRRSVRNAAVILVDDVVDYVDDASWWCG